MTPAERDYQEALRRIREARESGSTSLDMSRLFELTRIPDELRELQHLTQLDISWCDKLISLEPLTGPQGLTQLSISGCRAITSLEPLAGLQGLTQLDISECRAITSLEPLTGLQGLTQLNISECRAITSLEPLTGLQQLTHLDINDCYAIKSLEPLAGIQGLTHLDIGGCRAITSLEPLAGLQGLTQLNIGGCRAITSLEPLAWLHGLTQLNIGGCAAITRLEPLAGLRDLKQLDLRKCSAITSLEPLAGLQGLTQVDISECRAITSLEPLAGLKGLTQVDISECRAITSLEPLAGLQGLTRLNMSWCNAITSLEPLAGLQALTQLNMSWCDAITSLQPLAGLQGLTQLEISVCDAITSLEPLAGLQALTQLNMSRCDAITSLVPLVGLKGLTHLDISECGAITSLQPLVGLDRMEKLTAKGFYSGRLVFPAQLARVGLELQLRGSLFANLGDELTGVLDEDVGPALTRHFAELGDASAELREVKLMLLGNGRAGKSSLVRALRGEPHSRKEKSTHGIRHWRWSPSIELKGDENHGPQPVDVNIWDFGGQQIYHELHRLFMGTRAVFILLWNPWENEWKEDEDNPDHPADFKDDEYHPLDYWLDQIHAYSRLRQPQIILVRNFMDKDKAYEDKYERRAPASWKEAVSARYRNAENIQYVEFSAADREGALGRKRMGELRLALEYALNEQMRQLMSRYIPKGRYELRQYLAGLVKDGPADEGHTDRKHTLTKDEFDALVAQYCTVNSTYDTPKVLHFLHDIGALYYNERMPDKVVIDQRWLVDAIYAMLKEPHTREALKEQEGRFTMSDLVAWGWRDYMEEERKLFLDFMHSCGVAAEFISAERSAPGETVYLAPAFLPSGQTSPIKRLLASQPQQGRREQAWTEHERLGRDVTLHAVAKAAEAFGNMGVYWRYGFLIQGNHGVQVSMRWEAIRERSFGGKLILYATGERGSGKSTLVNEVIRVIEGCKGFPSEASWTREELSDDQKGGPKSPPEPVPMDGSSRVETERTPRSGAEPSDSFSPTVSPAKEKHSPRLIGFSYKGRKNKADPPSRGEHATRALWDALSKCDLDFGILDYQHPEEHDLHDVRDLMAAFRYRLHMSIAFLESGYWQSEDCLSELAMIYGQKPKEEFEHPKQQLIVLDDSRPIANPNRATYSEDIEPVLARAKSYWDSLERKARTLPERVALAMEDKRYPWYFIAADEARSTSFFQRVSEYIYKGTGVDTSTSAALNAWAEGKAKEIISYMAQQGSKPN